MAGYQQPTGSNIGNLLRAIQEEKNQSPLLNPTSDVNSPIRNLTQQPLQQVEAPDSSRVAVVRPELNTAAEPLSGRVTAPSGPTQTMAAPGQVVAPQRASYFSARADAAAQAAGGGNVGGGSSVSGGRSAVSSPGIGTRITSAPVSARTPARPAVSYTGPTKQTSNSGLNFNQPNPKPKPQPQRAPPQQRFGQFIVDLGRKLFPGAFSQWA